MTTPNFSTSIFEGCNQAPVPKERAMCETGGRSKAADTRGIFGSAETGEETVTCTITAESTLQKPSEFETLLLAMAGHDLRQPLHVIQGALDALAKSGRTEADVRMLQFGQNAVDQLRDQIDQLLAAMRFRDEATRLIPVSTGLLLQQACRENAVAASRKKVKVRVVETTSTIRSNPYLLGTVFRNVVSNAIKYSEPGGRVLLGCRHLGEKIRIDVYDTGIGLTKDQMPRIFEAFTRLNPGRSYGFGVGLFIVRQAIGLLGHRIDICSVPSRGTRFSVFAAKADQSEA
jgi:two-component system, OmpR family, phosphate regulon sensor histidine kinase PhoR